MSIFSHHLASFTLGPSSNTASTSQSTGICLSASLNPIVSSTSYSVIDSGATRLICSNIKLFTSLRPIVNSTITLPNNTCIFITSVGDVMLSSKLILNDILCVPEFKFNLLSVSGLTSAGDDLGLIVHFLHDFFYIQDTCSKKMLGMSCHHNDLYLLDPNSLTYASIAYVNNISAQTWHNRLGHLSFKRLDSLKDQLFCDVFTLKKV